MTGAAPLLLVALLLDAAFGEPKLLWARLPHPVILLGRAVELVERRLNRGRGLRLRGAVAVALLVAGALLLGWALGRLPGAAAIEVALAAILLAQRSLVAHVAAVAAALRLSVGDGRLAVARIVGRDTAAMDGPAVARAAIESAAENLSDGVVAPAFWFLLGGLPGLLAYKAINTADSMIGHRTPRFEAFGWAAARLDDAMNWVPARMTACLIVVVHVPPKDWWRGGDWGWAAIARDASGHRSPNAGWPEAAMARVLGTALAGPRGYGGRVEPFAWVNPEGDRAPGPPAIDAAIAVLWRAWGAMLAVLLALSLL